MSQYITKNKLTVSQAEQLIEEKENIIASLRSENSLLRNIVSQVPGHVYWISKTGEYMGANKNVWNRQMGLSSENEFIGKKHTDFFNAETAAHLSHADNLVIQTGKEQIVEEYAYSNLVVNQPAVYLTIKSPLINDEGEIIGIVGSSFDITDRKKMEQDLKTANEKAIASDHAKSQFIAVMNHELNTPLASIIGLVNLLKHENNFQGENKKLIDTIENCTNHLLGLVNQVLDFSKLDKGNVSVNKSFIDLSDIIHEVQNLLKITANNKNLKLLTHIDNSIQETIHTDAGILRQILINLINNAIKFTESGSISIEAKMTDKKSETAKIQITVADTGCGMPPDKLDLIFEPFQQLDDAYVRQSSRYGTGLGLAIVKKLCEQLGLDIHVSSIEGKGSTFTMTGEFKIGDLKSAKITPAPQKEKNITSKVSLKTSTLMLTAKKLRVLMVEDDPVIQYIHKKMLDQFKCRVDVVSNGRDAIKALNEHDVILVDINLPDISGFDVIKTIRQKSNAPIIALTAHTGKKEKQASLKAGASKFICKPVSQNQLRAILIDIVTKK